MVYELSSFSFVEKGLENAKKGQAVQPIRVNPVF